jgi:hypothetical protein
MRADRGAYGRAYPTTYDSAFAAADFRPNGCTDTTTDCTTEDGIAANG